MQARGPTGKNWAALRTRLVANGDDVVELLAAREEVGHGLGRAARKVEADLGHYLHDDRIQLSGLDACALGVEIARAGGVEECLGHLAASAVMNAYKENFLFHTQSVAMSKARSKALLCKGTKVTRLSRTLSQADGANVGSLRKSIVVTEGLGRHLSSARQAVWRSVRMNRRQFFSNRTSASGNWLMNPA